MKTALQILIIFYLTICLNINICLASEQKLYTPTAVISIQKGKTEDTAPFSLNLDGRNSKDPQNLELEFKWIYPNSKIITSKNPRSYKFETPGTYTILLTVTNPLGFSDSTEVTINALEKKEQNGDLSTEIYINEVFPNPKGKDEKKEWIELFNNSNKDINLKNWKISNTNSSQKITNKTIKAKSYLTIEKLKINLKNKAEQLQLFDFNNNLIDEIHYQNAIENLSYSRKQAWTNPTKNSKNNEIIILEGKILSPPENNSFKIKNKEINYSDEIDENLIKLILKENKEIKIKVEKNKEKLIMKNLEILAPTKSRKHKEAENWTLKTILFIESLIPLLIYSYNKSFRSIAV